MQVIFISFIRYFAILFIPLNSLSMKKKPDQISFFFVFVTLKLWFLRARSWNCFCSCFCNSFSSRSSCFLNAQYELDRCIFNRQALEKKKKILEESTSQPNHEMVDVLAFPNQNCGTCLHYNMAQHLLIRNSFSNFQ